MAGKDGGYWQLQDYGGPHNTGQKKILEAKYGVTLGVRDGKIRAQGHPRLHVEFKASLVSSKRWGEGEEEKERDREYLVLAMMVAYAYNLGTWKAEVGLKAKDSVGYKQTFLGN